MYTTICNSSIYLFFYCKFHAYRLKIALLLHLHYNNNNYLSFDIILVKSQVPVCFNTDMGISPKSKGLSAKLRNPNESQLGYVECLKNTLRYV